ncbi:MAG: dihydroxyacetone kinase subunit L [Frankiales bacterium]|nr:dihydroxyacetone kinase subunit L [Frankiales bacterium]
MSDGVTRTDLEHWLQVFAKQVEDNKELLTELDAAIGDADHGVNMDRGLKAVLVALEQVPQATPAALFNKVGLTLVSTVGGASGPLYGTFFLRFGGAVGDEEPVPATQFAAALRAGLDGVVARGKAEPGDKTMYDALAPAIDALDAGLAAGEVWADALTRAVDAASAGREATIEMLARKGRASYLGERSIGHQDPGATSAALLVASANEALHDCA